MQLFRTLNPSVMEQSSGRALTIGVYDGVHVGHQAILRELVRRAREAQLTTTVMSFEPMPREFFAESDPPARLTRFREKFELLRTLGIDELYCPRFLSVRHLQPTEFIDELLVHGLGTRHVVVGEDFRFAANRAGDVARLRSAGKHAGFAVTGVAAVYWQRRRVSSTDIRLALRDGDLETARGMLGRDYSMSGRVVRGLGLGRELGYPTANVNLSRRQTPVDGIFAARVAGLGDAPLDGVASVGTRPTVGGSKPLLEVHIFDFDRDIYGKHITVQFVERLREERKYPDVESMVRQIHEDVTAARAALAA